jgi:tRNA nucleotidyltransferase (CCA-adding enzyme)
MRIPHIVQKLSRIFIKQGFECFLVGGATRDLIMKRDLTDYDIATNATPEAVQGMFNRVIPTGIKHGTVTVLFQNDRFEVTTFRIDGVYFDRRRPGSVQFTPTIFEDLKRRDFTINGIAYDLKEQCIVDPHDGMEDLKIGIIRAIGDPVERLSEDALRNLRACRIACQLKFRIEDRTKEAIKKTRFGILEISKERIRDELVKIVLSDDSVLGFELLEEMGLLKLILPELHSGIGVQQKELHRYDVFHHSLCSCSAAPQENLVLKLAALFHDVGKAAAAFIDEDGEPRFHRHEMISAEMAEDITKRLKFPNEVIRRVTHLIRHHMFHYQDEWTDAAVRRFIARVGAENIQDLLSLRQADQIGSGFGSRSDLNRFVIRINRVLDSEVALGIKDLKLNGNDLLKLFPIQQGPKVGIILNFLLESVLEDPQLNERKRLIALAKNFYTDRLEQG